MTSWNLTPQPPLKGLRNLISRPARRRLGVLNKKRVSYLYRTATTAYPCYLPILGEFSRSWSYKTYPAQKYYYLRMLQNNYSKLTQFHGLFITFLTASKTLENQFIYPILRGSKLILTASNSHFVLGSSLPLGSG